jgi:endonuclease/exonuclease/phosphatase family metal-dependent hydrolase
VALLVRTWNLFHGNAVPPERRAYLEEMVRLVTADDPDIVCLQEVPLWALRRLEQWSGRIVVGAVAARPRLGSAAVGRLLTDLNHGVLRSAFTGQANAILLASRLRLTHAGSTVLSRRGEGERRILQILHVEGVGVVANLHVTTQHAARQLQRALDRLESVEEGTAIVLCGDLNVRPGVEPFYDVVRDEGFSTPAPGIDQVLVRGLPASTPVVWPQERRRVDGRLLSDHAPVELSVG